MHQEQTLEASPRHKPDLLRRGLGILYWVGIGYPLAAASIHLIWNLNDHSLTLLVLPLLLPALALLLVLALSRADWLARLKLAARHVFLVFLATLGSSFGLAFLDIFHCGFGN